MVFSSSSMPFWYTSHSAWETGFCGYNSSRILESFHDLKKETSSSKIDGNNQVFIVNALHVFIRWEMLHSIACLLCSRLMNSLDLVSIIINRLNWFNYKWVVFSSIEFIEFFFAFELRCFFVCARKAFVRRSIFSCFYCFCFVFLVFLHFSPFVLCFSSISVVIPEKKSIHLSSERRALDQNRLNSHRNQSTNWVIAKAAMVTAKSILRIANGISNEDYSVLTWREFTSFRKSVIIGNRLLVMCLTVLNCFYSRLAF